MNDAPTGAASTPPTPTPAPKADPETLVLRAKPPRTVRFRKGIIVAASGFGATLICSAAWLALMPAGTRPANAGDERAPLDVPKLPDALANAPTGYGDAPPLGPKLPGDLGRPILRHQRDLEMAEAGTGSDAEARATEQAEAERQRLAAEDRAARESDIILRRSGGQAGGALATGVAMPTLPERGEAAQGAAEKHSLAFRNEGGSETSPHRLVEPVSPWTVHAGSIISASLITGLNSDLPGLVTAQITTNVHDSVTGRTVLVPQGSRLVGSYDNVVAFGQSRALVVWQRIILPDGSSIRLDNTPASDTEGYAGLADRIDRHTWQLLKGVVLSTLLGVGTELGLGSAESDLVRALRESTQQNAARAGDQIVARNLDIQPTVRIRPGWPVRIVVHKDLVLQPWLG
jgi:type IV secretion system protein VirB10